MKKMLFSDHENLHMRWESLICSVFDTYLKYDDPLGMAVQDELAVYLYSGDDEKFREGKMVLSATLGAIAYRIKDEHYTQEQLLIKELFEELKNAKTPEEMEDIVDRCIVILKNLGL